MGTTQKILEAEIAGHDVLMVRLTPIRIDEMK